MTLDSWDTNLKEPLTSLFNTVRILLISEKEEGWIEVNYGASSEQVYKEVGRRFNHASGKVQNQTVDIAGVQGAPIPSTDSPTKGQMTQGQTTKGQTTKGQTIKGFFLNFDICYS